jgi:hypothetical protein
MSRNDGKTARMPAMKFPKLQKRLRMSGAGKGSGTRRLLMSTGKAGGTRAKMPAPKGPARNRKRF